MTENNNTVPTRTRTPRSAETITKGALELPYEDRVNLCKALKDSIKNEVEANAAKAAEQQEMAKGL